VVPQLTVEWGLSGAGGAWLTMSVQIGFVVGALLSAVLNVADLVPAHRLLAACMLRLRRLPEAERMAGGRR
jgi:hypothetical protein